DFDDGLLQQISEVAYEDEPKHILSPPDVSHYWVSEDDPPASNGNKGLTGHDGMADAEVERRLKDGLSASSTAPNKPIMHLDPRIASAIQRSVPSSSLTVHIPTVQQPSMPFLGQQLPQVTTLPKPRQAEINVHSSSPALEEGEVLEPELDPDTRRRLLILQHGQDVRESPPSESQFPARPPPMQAPTPRAPPHGWFPIEEEMNPRQVNRAAPPVDFIAQPPFPVDNIRTLHPPFLHKMEAAMSPGRVLENQRLPKKELPRDEFLRLPQPVPDYHFFSGDGSTVAQLPSTNKDLDLEDGQIDAWSETSSTGVLEDIAFKCGTKVEFRHILVPSTALQFCVEVFFAGEKVGEGIGRTRREAQRQAAEGSLLYLADKYLSQLQPDSSYMPKEEAVQTAPLRIRDPRVEASKKSMSSIAALKELCMREGLDVAYQTQSQFSGFRAHKNEVYAEVEINGQVLGKGIGLTWEEAKSQAAEKAIGAMNSMLGQQAPYKRMDSPRSMQGMSSNKRFKPGYSRALHRMPSSVRQP
ncbi:hypothetical protein MIMGU_mgv1a0014621mg, partial [Erythranthe guttata]